MTKKDIVLQIAERPQMKELSQVQIKSIVQAALESIVDTLSKGKNVELRNFGVFKVKKRRPRMARNPKTLQKVSVPERNVVVFKPGLIMRKKVTGQ